MLRRWIALPPHRRTLLGAAVFWVLAAQLVLRAPRKSFPEQQHALDALAQRLPPLRLDLLADATWAVTAAAKRVPRTECLPWALALRGLLTQASIASELRIGVAPDADNMIKAHAWVECNGQSLSWNEAIADYSVLGPRIEPS